MSLGRSGSRRLLLRVSQLLSSPENSVTVDAADSCRFLTLDWSGNTSSADTRPLTGGMNQRQRFAADLATAILNHQGATACEEISPTTESDAGVHVGGQPPVAEPSLAGLKELVELVERHESASWAIADCAMSLSRQGISLRQMETAINKRWSKSMLHNYIRTADAFPPEKRQAGVSFHVYHTALQSLHGQPEQLRKTPDQIAAAIVEGQNTPRQISRWVTNKAHDARAADLASKVTDLPTTTPNTHFGFWEDFVATQPEGFITGACWADPCYGAYERSATRKTTIVKCDGSNLPNQAACQTPEAAWRTTINLLKILPPKMSAGVPLFLIQHGKQPPAYRLLRWAQRFGWKQQGMIAWRYAHAPAASYLGNPYGPVCSWILVFTHGDHSLPNYAGGANSNYIESISPTRATAQAARRGENPMLHHVYEHQPELVETILRRVVPMDSKAMIFEPFGCTAPASVAAIRCGWRYAYCDANEYNYNLGRMRIQAAMEVMPAQSADVE